MDEEGQTTTFENNDEFDWPRLEVTSISKKLLFAPAALNSPQSPMKIFYMEQLAFVDSFLREYDKHTIIYGIGDDPQKINAATSGPSVYLSFKLRHSIHHCNVSWVSLKPGLMQDKASVDSSGFQRLMELDNFSQDLDTNWFSQIASCPEFLDQPFESVDVQRELQFRSHLILVRQKAQKQGEFAIMIYRHSELGRVKKIQQRTITINFQKQIIKDDKSSRMARSFQDVIHEITNTTSALLSSRKQKKNITSSKTVEALLNLNARASHDTVLAYFLNIREAIVGKSFLEIGMLFKTNGDIQSLVHVMVQRLCGLTIVSNATPRGEDVRRIEKSYIEDDIRVAGVEVLEVLCSYKGAPLCNQAPSIAVLHLLVICKGTFADFFLEWRPVGLLTSLYELFDSDVCV